MMLPRKPGCSAPCRISLYGALPVNMFHSRELMWRGAPGFACSRSAMRRIPRREIFDILKQGRGAEDHLSDGIVVRDSRQVGQ